MFVIGAVVLLAAVNIFFGLKSIIRISSNPSSDSKEIKYDSGAEKNQPELNRVSDSSDVVNIPAANNNTLNYSASWDGIEIAIDSIKREKAQTTLNVVMNNHRYNLGEFDVKKFSSWDGKSPVSYTILGNQVGGHHITANLVFPGEPKGKLVIGLNQDILFTFDIS